MEKHKYHLPDVTNLDFNNEKEFSIKLTDIQVPIFKFPISDSSSSDSKFFIRKIQTFCMATLQIPDLLTEFELFLTNLNLQKHLQKFHPTVKSFFNCHKLCFLETLDIMLEFLNKNKKACAKKFEGSHSYEENSKSMYNLWKELKREAKMNILQENFFEGFLKSKENIYNELSFKDEAYFYNFMDILKKLDEIFYLSWNRIKYKIFSSNNKLLKIGDI